MAPHSLFALFLLSCIPNVISVPQGEDHLRKLHYNHTDKLLAPLSSVTPAAQFLQSAQPDLAGPASASTGAPVSCGGCYVVADVAGLVWYSEVFINTAATALVSVGAGGNGTQATRTSIVQNEGDFTFGPGIAPTGAALNQINFDSSITISGAVLQSPTAYNVFTAYSVTSATLSDGICVTNSGPPIALSSAYTEILTSANGKVFLDQNGEQQFINFLGFTTCSAGGESIVPTALVQVSNITATSTATNTGGPVVASTVSLSLSVPLVCVRTRSACVCSLLTLLFSLGVCSSHQCHSRWDIEPLARVCIGAPYRGWKQDRHSYSSSHCTSYSQWYSPVCSLHGLCVSHKRKYFDPHIPHSFRKYRERLEGRRRTHGCLVLGDVWVGRWCVFVVIGLC